MSLQPGSWLPAELLCPEQVGLLQLRLGGRKGHHSGIPYVGTLLTSLLLVKLLPGAANLRQGCLKLDHLPPPRDIHSWTTQWIEAPLGGSKESQPHWGLGPCFEQGISLFIPAESSPSGTSLH